MRSQSTIRHYMRLDTENLNGSIRLFIIDEQPVVLEGLCSYVKECDGLRVVGQSLNYRNAFEELVPSRADLLIFGMSVDLEFAYRSLEGIHRLSTTAKIISYSVHHGTEIARETIRRGALGYVSKRSPLETLRSAIYTVAKGGTFVDPGVAEIESPKPQRFKKSTLTVSLQTRFGTPHTSQVRQRLTRQETKIVTLLVEGLTLKEVAVLLNVTHGTMISHIKTIHQKCEVHTRGALVAKVLRNGLL